MPEQTTATGTTLQHSKQAKPKMWLPSFLGALITMGIVICIAASVFTFFLPAARSAIQVRQRTMGLSNAKQIADALNSYRRTHGSYPTPTVHDASGKPLYSWRVLILPQLGYSSLYDIYQLDQTWDSPTNQALLSRMPLVFACPGNATAIGMHETNFALIVGLGSMFPPGASVDPETMTDDPSETLLVVETKDGVIAWTQPGDLDTVNGITIGSIAMRDIGGNYPGCAIAVTVDGATVVIDPSISRATLDAIITPNGNEKVDFATVHLPASH